MGWPFPPLVPPDVELAVTSELAPLVSPVPVATDYVGWAFGDSRVVVTALPGIVEHSRVRYPINVACTAGSKSAASDLARAVHAAMLGLPLLPGSALSVVSASTAPYPVPMENAPDGVSRYAASYLVLASSRPA